MSLHPSRYQTPPRREPMHQMPPYRESVLPHHSRRRARSIPGHGPQARATFVWFCVTLLLTTTAVIAQANHPAATQPARYSRAQIDDAISRGVEFLQKHQQSDGSWGTGLETRGTEVYAMVPGSLDSFRIGASSLAVMALREAGESKAHDKGLEYLLKVPDAKRDEGDLIYNTWAHIYLLQAMAEEMPSNHDPRVRQVAERQIDRLLRYATWMGGWNYYDFEAHTQHPSMGPTSFGTAAGLVALHEAKAAGLEVPEKLIKQSLQRLAEMRLPNGVYLYGSDYKYIPRLPANRPRGAVGRTQPANYARMLWGSDKLTKNDLRQGLDLLREDHAFLDMGRKRPIPHEAWYQTAGYYYYFDHYYASRLFELLDSVDKETYAPMLIAGVLPHQEPDGSWWDFAMWDFHKPYGTAFAVMTLLRCR